MRSIKTADIEPLVSCLISIVSNSYVSIFAHPTPEQQKWQTCSDSTGKVIRTSLHLCTTLHTLVFMLESAPYFVWTSTFSMNNRSFVQPWNNCSATKAQYINKLKCVQGLSLIVWARSFFSFPKRITVSHDLLLLLLLLLQDCQ